MFSKKNKPARLHRIDDPHKHDKMHLEETLVAISPILIVIMITILVVMAIFCFGNNHVFSTEANTYEHLNQIVLCTMDVMIWIG